MFLIWNCSFSQNYTNYTIADGLPSNHVYKLTQDSNGFIWFATDKGLVRYNGSSMKTFTTKDGLATNDIWNMFPTQDGKMWFLSKTSKLGYIQNDSVFNFESEQKGEIFNPIFTNHLNNEVILASPSKSHGLVNGKWKVLMENEFRSERNILYVKHPNVKSLEVNYHLDSVKVYIKPNSSKTFNFKNKLNSIHKRGQITDSLFYWIDKNTYHVLNLNSLKLYNYTFKDELSIKEVLFPRINMVNNQLQISGKGFVGVLDQDFRIKNTFLFPEDIDAHFGFIDKSGSFWLTSFNDGVYQFPLEKQNVKYCLQGEKILNIKQVNNKILANVFNKGIYSYDVENKLFKPFILEKDFFFDMSFVKETNTEYYLTGQNIFKIKNGKLTKRAYVKSANVSGDIFRQLLYHNNNLYGIFSTGIAKLNPISLNIEEEYMQNGINELFKFNEELLVATTSGLKRLKDGEIDNVLLNKQIFNKSILSLVKVSDSEILINTDGFGSYISDLKVINPLPKSEFLIVNNAFNENDIIWLATDSGVLKYHTNIGEYNFQSKLDKTNGLPSNQVNSVVISDGNVIVGTNSGITILPDAANEAPKTSKILDIYIDEARYSDSLVSNNSVFDYHKNNNLNITVSSIDFSGEHSNFSYEYKLEPVQKNWTHSKFNRLNFNDIQPGNYTFTVKSNTFQKTLDFKIKPLWYQLLWLKALTVSLVMLFVVYLSRYYVKRAQFKKNQKIFEDKRLSELQLKALRSQMNPHFVFNSLSAIQYYITENDTKASESYLVKFSQLIRQFFEFSKKNEITLASEIKLLENYLDIEKLRFIDELDYLVNVDSNLEVDKIKIPTMLLQPIVENAVNHGVFNKMENGLITINFIKLDSQTFKVEIIDDGVGFANTHKDDGKREKSTNVLNERLYFLNHSGKWSITYKREEAFPAKADKGNKSIFIIRHKNS